jgi:hypothetical protein
VRRKSEARKRGARAKHESGAQECGTRLRLESGARNGGVGVRHESEAESEAPPRTQSVGRRRARGTPLHVPHLAGRW